MKTRNDLCRMFAERGYTTGAEVGVYAGDFSETLLWLSGVRCLYLVDPWAGTGMKHEWDGDAMYCSVVDRMATFAPRVHILRQTSTEAAEQLFRALCNGPDQQGHRIFDFVYIDACHDYDNVYQDVWIWQQMVKNGGVISGHDYKNLGRRKQVKRAVDELFPGGVNVTGESCPSWWVEVA